MLFKYGLISSRYSLMGFQLLTITFIFSIIVALKINFSYWFSIISTSYSKRFSISLIILSLISLIPSFSFFSLKNFVTYYFWQLFFYRFFFVFSFLGFFPSPYTFKHATKGKGGGLPCPFLKTEKNALILVKKVLVVSSLGLNLPLKT